jgi:hypothetical protein
MSAGHSLIGFIVLLQSIYYINHQRKPYFFGLSTKSTLVQNQLGKGILIGLYIFIAVAALGVVVQDICNLIISWGNH